MSLEDFIAHLPSQPWASAYIHNFLAYETKQTSFDYLIGDAFIWPDFPEQHSDWGKINTHHRTKLNTTRATFKSELLKLKDTHPELFL